MCCHGNKHSWKKDVPVFVMGELAKKENYMYTPVFSSYNDTSRRDHLLDVYVPGSVGAGCYGVKSACCVVQ